MFKYHIHSRRIEDFAPMVNQYGPAFMAFVGRIVTIQEDAEDVVQEAFVTAYEHLNDYAPEKASLKTWLYRIAHSRVVARKCRQIFDHKYPGDGMGRSDAYRAFCLI